MTPGDLANLLEATWPPAGTFDLGPFRLRNGAGGGKRVSAASVSGAWSEADLAAAEAAMSSPLFMISPSDAQLDSALAERGYRAIDPVVAYSAPTRKLTGNVPPLAAFPHWPPLEIAQTLWEEGGIGPARVAVMVRTAGPKTAVLARSGDKPVGVAFVALHRTDAMLHALEVSAQHRRQGVGSTVLRAAANWAADAGAARLSLVVTERNLAARALYDRAGMEVVGQYHYRIR